MTEPAPPKRRRWLLRIGVAVVAALLALAGGALLLVDSDYGHRLIADQIRAMRPADGMRYSVGRISGSVWSKVVFSDVAVSDPHGLVFAAPRAEFDWRPLAWFANRLDIRTLRIARATLAKLPEPRPSKARRAILPDFDIAIGMLTIDRLTVAPAITGVAREGALRAAAEVRRGRALVSVDARIAGSDAVVVRLDAAPARDRFVLGVHAVGARRGLLAQAAGLDQPLALSVGGRGGWRQWQGRALGRIGGAPALDLVLTNTAGRYAARGWARADAVIAGKAARIFAPRLAITANASFADRVIDGALGLRTSAFVAEARGAIDLGRTRYRDLRVRLRLLDPPRVVDRMAAQNAELRLIADGPMNAAAIDYRLTADRLNFGGREVLEGVRAGGTVALRRGAAVVPLGLSVARVSGVDAPTSAILRNLSLGGAVRVEGRAITGADLPLKSDKLDGSLNLLVNLHGGRFDIGLNAALRRYVLAGFGLIDASVRLRAVPAPGGGAQILGEGAAQVLRLDNQFFAGLAEGQPRLNTRLAQGPDGILHFDQAVLSAPAIRAAITGFHRRDGSFHIEGSGAHSRYGPLDVVLDGRIERPTIDLKLAHPNADLALEGMTARLDPTPEGYDFNASGGSLLGDFTGRGQLLLPPGAEATIAVAALDVADLHAHGALRVASGGLDGRLELGGRGTGGVGLSVVDQHQRVEAHLNLADAKLGDRARLKRGRIDLVALLDPAGSSVEAKATGSGLRQDNLVLGRFALAASLRGGTGTATAEASGTRGRPFDLRAEAQITPDRYRITGSGQIDRRPVKLAAPAVLMRDGDGWRLVGAVLKVAEGEARLAGSYQRGAISGTAAMTRLPLSLLDIGWPGLGLSGSASGTLDYAEAPGRAPGGRIDLTVRGLSRAGLVLSSQPIDLGLAGVLGGESAGMRAVMASGGKTIGRAQARLAPFGTGALAERLTHAGLFAQVRYDGPADTLWRLTGIELFDLSGPVAIGADVSGRVDDPRITGVVKAKGARLESARTGTVLTNVQGTGQFSGSVLNLGEFTADAGKGGRVSGSGVFDLAAAHGFGIDLKLQAAKAVMINRDDIGATVTGPIIIHSDGDGGLISGDVVLDQSRYRLGQAVATSAVPKLNAREINLPDEGEDEARALKPWRLDVRARATDSLTVSGLGLTSLWSATMQLGGGVDAPTISGRADLTRGSVEFSGRDFAISRGVIRFTGNSPPDPAIDIAATGDTTGLSATISVTGPASKPAIAFSSTPALPQDELLSRLLFGTSITNLSAPEAVQLASAIASLQSPDGGLNPINALRRVVGLDRLRILPADKSVGRTTSFAAGKFITRRLYAEIITDGQGYSATQVEFQITRWLSILSTISTIGRQSANVRVSKDY